MDVDGGMYSDEKEAKDVDGILDKHTLHPPSGGAAEEKPRKRRYQRRCSEAQGLSSNEPASKKWKERKACEPGFDDDDRMVISLTKEMLPTGFTSPKLERNAKG